jgi:Caspase domain/Glucodextranase, domain B
MTRLHSVPGSALAVLLVLACFLADAARPDLAFAPEGGGGGGGGVGGGGGGGGAGGDPGAGDVNRSEMRSFTDWGTSSPPAPAVQDSTPPRITVQGPAALQSGREARVTEAEAVLTGVATDDSRIKRFLVNGREARLDWRGRFRETLRLAPGANAVTLVAEDEHGNRAEVSYSIVREAPPAPVAAAAPPAPVAAAAPPAPAAAPAPRISVLEPPGDFTTRTGQSVRVRPLPEFDVVGQVLAPGGLLQLKVNDRTVTANESGVFRVPVALGGRPAPVSIVAIDNQGRRTVVEFTLVPDVAAGPAPAATGPVAAAPPAASSRPRIDFGRYHALVIGNNAYRQIRPLETAAGDATAVAKLLRERYGHEVTLLINATREQIVIALDQLRAKLTERDNLLIYYAGHGVVDNDAGRGYWLPVDARPDTRAQWLSNTEVTDTLKAMSARHVMVIADSCYAGTLLREDRGITLVTGTERDVFLARISQKRSRTVLSSGGVEPVLDAGGGRHSVFAKAFLEALEQNPDVLDGQALFARIRRPVVLNSPQTPEYSDIRLAGHDGGDFLFVRR